MYKPPYNPIFDDPNNPKASYNKRYRFLYYLSGLGMTVYNRVKYGLETDLYTRLFIHLLTTDGFTAVRNAERTLYWDNTPLAEPYHIPLLVNDNVMVDIYSQPTLTNQERSITKHRMDLTHTRYAIIMNFSEDTFYSEWYHRDPDTAIIDKIKLL